MKQDFRQCDKCGRVLDVIEDGTLQAGFTDDDERYCSIKCLRKDYPNHASPDALTDNEVQGNTTTNIYYTEWEIEEEE